MSTDNHKNIGPDAANASGRKEGARSTQTSLHKEHAAELRILNERLQRLKGLGPNPRRRRIDKLERALTRRNELRYGMDQSEAGRRARREVDNIKARYTHVTEAYEEVAPSWESPDATDLHDHIWTHAILSVPQVAYFKRELERRESGTDRRGRKPKGDRQLPVAVFMHMALSGEAPDATATLKSFQGNPFRMWSLHNPQTGPSYKAMMRSIKGMLTNDRAELLQHTMVDLARDAAEKTDENGELLHPGFMDTLVVDGVLVQAPVDQHKPMDEVDAARTRGRKRPKVAYVVYSSTRSFEQAQQPENPDQGYEPRQAGDEPPLRRRPPKKTCHGYKYMQLSSLKGNRPVIAGLFPATVDEREATLELLDLLYRWWKGVKIKVLVGDSLYDTAPFCDELFFRYGIQPVFSRGRKPSALFDFVEGNEKNPGINGVPTCDHGLMEMRSKDDWYDADRRADLEIPPGAPAPNREARLRYKCPKGICKGKSAWIRKNPRLYTLHPRIGLDDLVKLEQERKAEIDAQRASQGKPPARTTPRESVRNRFAARRIALEAQRNTVESLFASIKADELAGEARLRAAWAEDDQMECLLLMHSVGLLARLHVWEDGGYERSLQEAERLDLTRIPTPDNPGCGPTADDLKEAIAARVAVLPRKPRSWRRPGDHHAVGTEELGYLSADEDGEPAAA